MLSLQCYLKKEKKTHERTSGQIALSRVFLDVRVILYKLYFVPDFFLHKKSKIKRVGLNFNTLNVRIMEFSQVSNEATREIRQTM